MLENYIKKLEEENVKLYNERTYLFTAIKSIATKSNLNIKFEDAVNSVTSEMLNAYVLKKYPIIEIKESAWEHITYVNIGGKKHSVLTWKKPQQDQKKFEESIIQQSFMLFKVVWDDYNAVNKNQGSLKLLLDILTVAYN